MRSASLPEGFFLGQIPPNWNEYLRASSWKDAHNNRVKVRIPGKHSKGDEVCDKDLPWAIVEQSTSSGNLNGSSVGLWGGEWVTGYFLDKDEQLPVITGVLGANTIEEGKISESACSTQFKPVKRFNSGLVAPASAIGSGNKPKEPAKIDKKTVEEATKGMGEGSKSDAELEAEGQTEDQSPAELAAEEDIFINPDAPDPESTSQQVQQSDDMLWGPGVPPATEQQIAESAALDKETDQERAKRRIELVGEERYREIQEKAFPFANPAKIQAKIDYAKGRIGIDEIPD